MSGSTTIMCHSTFGSSVRCADLGSAQSVDLPLASEYGIRAGLDEMSQGPCKAVAVVWSKALDQRGGFLADDRTGYRFELGWRYEIWSSLASQSGRASAATNAATSALTPPACRIRHQPVKREPFGNTGCAGSLSSPVIDSEWPCMMQSRKLVKMSTEDAVQPKGSADG